MLVPAFLILLYAAIPLLSQREIKHWSVLGYDFRASESYSPVDDYWLDTFGSAAIASAAWSVIIFTVLQLFANQSERLSHPPASKSVRALRYAILLFGIISLFPLGCVLLLAANNQHW